MVPKHGEEFLLFEEGGRGDQRQRSRGVLSAGQFRPVQFGPVLLGIVQDRLGLASTLQHAGTGLAGWARGHNQRLITM